MFLEIKNSIIGKYPEKFLGALQPVQNEESYNFPVIGIPEINVQLFENFQDPVAL